MILLENTLSLQALLPGTAAELVQACQESLPPSVVLHHCSGHVQRACVRPGVGITIVTLQQGSIQHPGVGIWVEQAVHCCASSRLVGARRCLILGMRRWVVTKPWNEAVCRITQYIPCLQQQTTLSLYHMPCCQAALHARHVDLYL